jgi:serine protease DegQ
MMQRLWLLFAQTITVALALWFITLTLKPEWLGRTPSLRSARETPSLNLREAASPGSSGGAVTSYRDAAKLAMPAVVNIFTSKEIAASRNPWLRDPLLRRFFGEREQQRQQQRQSSLGSGVIVDTQGYILTNNHVVDGADEIEVALADGRKTAATIVGTDPESDLAVIRINLPKLPAITIGHSEQAQVGDVVLAIGNPFGVGQTVTMGIVSALGRDHLGINRYENFIQTDAAINPGNSGGALIDTQGNLIGVNSAIYSQSGGSLGIGFAIPIATAKSVMESIIRSGHVVRGWIGVEPQELTAELAESLSLKQKSGTIITAVVRNGPADRAGMKPGDLMLSVEGKPIRDTTQMVNLIAQLAPGSTARVMVLRKNQETALDIVIGKRPPVTRPQADAE